MTSPNPCRTYRTHGDEKVDPHGLGQGNHNGNGNGVHAPAQAHDKLRDTQNQKYNKRQQLGGHDLLCRVNSKA